MKNYLFIACACLIFAFSISSCKDDEVVQPPVEEEVITTLNYTLTSTTGETVAMSFVDLDGDGGNAPIVTGGTLSANETYVGSLELLNESETPAEDITAEIMEEDEEHQFFFSTNIEGLGVAYADQDADGNPVGLNSLLTTGAAGSGTLTIILRHEPNKSGEGVAGGDKTNAGGETDIQVDFNVNVE